MTSAPRSARCREIAAGPSSELSMTRTLSSSPSIRPRRCSGCGRHGRRGGWRRRSHGDLHLHARVDRAVDDVLAGLTDHPRELTVVLELRLELLWALLHLHVMAGRAHPLPGDLLASEDL